MDYLSFFLLFSFIWGCVHVLKSAIFAKKSGYSTQLPPGPRPLPIIGNILELGQKPHQALANLSKTYGPLMLLKLGCLTTVVISSPNIAKEALQKHDQALSGRRILAAFQVDKYYQNSMSWLPASSAHWKNLRKVVFTQMFTSKKLDAGLALRQTKVQELLEYVNVNCISDQAVDIGQAAFTTVLNVITNTLFSVDLATYNSSMSHELSDLVIGIMEGGGGPSLADFFPILRFVDPQGVLRKMKIFHERLFGIFDGIINERTQFSASSMENNANNDVLDSLLILAKDTDYDFSFLDLKPMLLDILVGGTDTTVSTIEWAMAELLRNPEKLRKLKNEFKEVNGPIQESDISKFHYLQAIVKETLRLHPPAPLMIPHKAKSEVEICGFKVPKNAQILINVWAIATDPSIWEDPNLFNPERFLKSKIDVKGRDFELLPFGTGRRMCPGFPLASRIVPFMLASLVHSFDWKLANDMKPEDMDMSAQFGLALHKSTPLLAIPLAN